LISGAHPCPMMMTLILRDYDVHGDAGGNTATQ
jgi:hypothetical protein